MQSMNVKKLRDVTEELQSEQGVKTTLLSRNITVNGRRTSVRLEPEMWTSLFDIAKRESCSIHDICTLISLRKNPKTSLTAGIRVFLMLYYRASSTEEGHRRAGHGSFESMKHRAGLNHATMRKPMPENMSDHEMSKQQSSRTGGYIRQG